MRKAMPIQSEHKVMDGDCACGAMPQLNRHQAGELGHFHKLKPMQNEDLTT